MTVSAADIEAAYGAMRLATRYMTQVQLDAHVSAILAIAGAVTPVFPPPDLLPPATPPPPPPPSPAQVALAAAQAAFAADQAALAAAAAVVP